MMVMVMVMDLQHKTAPTACVEAHGEAALWQSWSSFLSSSVVSFFASPMLGAASDKYGRKPFIVLSTVMQILPMLMIVSYSKLHTSLLW
jgi:MFS family permease